MTPVSTPADDGAPPLPIEAHLDEILAAIRPGATVLLQAPPGAGKTTRLPLALLQHPPTDGRILLVEPRRLATTAAARRLATGLGQPVGGEIGYSIRLERRTSSATRLEVITGGILLRRVQNDPALDGVGCVILDEFHERPVEAELALALLRQARTLLRPDLCLILMSATLDLAPLAEQLDQATVISTPGRSHPVEVLHQSPRREESLQRQVVRGLEDHWIRERGCGETVLVFLPGRREIEAVRGAILETGWGAALECVPLHGQLPLEGQEEAIAPPRHPSGKVVLATSIAESSLTIEAVRLVVDSGLSRVSRFDPGTGMTGLITVVASRASAEQRRGRAGRQAPGRCLRLWGPGADLRRPLFDPPGLLEADPLPLALELSLWGTPKGETLPWMQPPAAGPLQEASRQLRLLEATDGQGRITPHGRRMANLGIHPRLAHMLLLAERHGWLDLASGLAVLLEERDPLERRQEGADLLRRLDWLLHGDPPAATPTRERHIPQGARENPQRRHLRRLQARLQRQVRNATTVHRSPPGHRPQQPESETTEVTACRLISWAYPDRVALSRGRGDGRYLLRNGHGAWLPPEDPLASAQALAIAHLDGRGAEARIRLAVPLTESVLEELAVSQAETVLTTRWDGASQRVRCERSLRLGALVLERSPWAPADPMAVSAALLEAVRQMGLEVLPWTPSSRQLQQRLSLAHRLLGAPWPDRSQQWLATHLPEWLQPHLGGLWSRQDLQTLDLNQLLWGESAWSLRQELDRLLPQHLVIASGRTVRLDYSSGHPVLAAKLQEFFGSTTGPRILEGRLPITLQLLSPAGRPVAITTDLGGFWSVGYHQVRRELRGRYPKHPWPDDPLQAEATSLTNARLRAGGRSVPT